MSAKKDKTKSQTFEEALKDLEEIVQVLEKGDQPLEIAIKKFEEGIRLSNLCSSKLDETEKKITMLVQDSNGDFVEKPFKIKSE